MSSNPVRVAALGMGWWSDVLADAAKRSGELEIVSCFTRSEDKRDAFAAKYGCKAVSSYDEILADDSIEAIINTTPNHAHLETTRAAALAGKHVFLDKPIANSIVDGHAITRVCKEAGVVLSVGYQRRRENQFQWIKGEIEAGRFGKLVQAEANMHARRGHVADRRPLHRRAGNADGAGETGLRHGRAAGAAGRQPRYRQPDDAA
jgi:predicted dehydrogenase